MKSKEFHDDEIIEESSGSPFFTLVIIAVILLPLTIAAALVYSLLRVWHLRPSFISIIVGVSELILAILWFALSASEKFGDFIHNITSFSTSFQDAIPAIVISLMALGLIIGLIIVFIEARAIEKNEHRRMMKDSWTYKFKYRKTPWEKFAKKKAIEDLKNGNLLTEDKAPLGIDETDLEDQPVYRHYEDARKHTIIIGASGSGKTITLLSLIHSDISLGLPVVVIDFKRSPELASKIAKWAHQSNRNFYHFANGDPKKYDIKHSLGQCFYDPIANGSSTSKADMVLGMREYDTASAVYKGGMQQLLQTTFAMLAHSKRKIAKSIMWEQGGLFELSSAIKGANFSELVASCERTPIEEAAQEIELEARSKQKNATTHAISELSQQLRMITVSDYGPWLKLSKDQKGRNIDLFELTKDGSNVILFSLDSDSEPEFASYIGSMIFADLTNVSARRRNEGLKNQVNVYSDEFQTVPPTAVTSLLEKSRESSIAMTLSLQSFDQIISSAGGSGKGQSYLNSILETCSNFIAHAGSNEDGAERLSKLLGKHWVTTYKSSKKDSSFFGSINFSNKRNKTVNESEEERWRFEPAEFMSLESPTKANNFRSTAVVVAKSSSDVRDTSRKLKGAIARRVWMIPNKEVLESYYVPKGFGVTAENHVPGFVPDFDIEDPLEKVFSEDEGHSQPTTPEPEYFPSEHDDTFEEVSYEDDDEGGFEFERIEEEPEPTPVVKEEKIKTQTELRKTTKRNTSSFDSLFGGDFVPEARVITPKRNPAPGKKIEPEKIAPTVQPRKTPSKPSMPVRPGLPINRGPGIPTMIPTDKPLVSKKEEIADFDLPDL